MRHLERRGPGSIPGVGKVWESRHCFYIWAPYPNILGIGDRIAFLQQAWLFP